MQKLTLTDVKAAANMAYEHRRLTAQHDPPACLYRLGDCGCAIGVALSPESMAKIKADKDRYLMSAPVTDLVEFGIVVIDQEELEEIAAIQRAHDAWCTARAELLDQILILPPREFLRDAEDRARLKFLEAIAW